MLPFLPAFFAYALAAFVALSVMVVFVTVAIMVVLSVMIVMIIIAVIMTIIIVHVNVVADPVGVAPPKPVRDGIYPGTDRVDKPRANRIVPGTIDDAWIVGRHIDHSGRGRLNPNHLVTHQDPLFRRRSQIALLFCPLAQILGSLHQLLALVKEGITELIDRKSVV